MASGTPVLATAVGGTPDVFEDGVSGLLVPSDDEAAMVQALNRLHDDAALAQGLARAARERAEQHYSIDRMVDAYAALFAREAAPRLQIA
jgi:glycosyltransferase involved in cell wall biosynthesis